MTGRVARRDRAVCTPDALHPAPPRRADLCRPETVCRFLCFRCSSASSCSCRTSSLARTSLRPRGTIYGPQTAGHHRKANCGHKMHRAVLRPGAKGQLSPSTSTSGVTTDSRPTAHSSPASTSRVLTLCLQRTFQGPECLKLSLALNPPSTPWHSGAADLGMPRRHSLPPRSAGTETDHERQTRAQVSPKLGAVQLG